MDPNTPARAAAPAEHRPHVPAPHDYEPGDTTHPMSTDPDCRVCGKTRRACERGR